MTKMTIISLSSQNTFNILLPVNKMLAHYHNKSYSTATKSFILSFVKLIVTGELMVDLDRDDPMVKAVDIPMSMANYCFIGVDMAAGDKLFGGT